MPTRFWVWYQALPAEVRELADRSFALLKSDPRHPSLHFKRPGELWSVRVGDHYRALGTDVRDGIYWVWIGTHAEYDKIIRHRWVIMLSLGVGLEILLGILWTSFSVPVAAAGSTAALGWFVHWVGLRRHRTPQQ